MTTWHAGERALQERAGVGARMAEVGARVVRDHMPDQHRAFFAELPFLLTGTLDAQGRPWAGALAGAPGFAHSPDPRRLRVDALPLVGDAVHLAADAPIALLGIQPHTRRRNRMNGRVSAIDAGGFEVTVGQSFGNCPKYIHPREVRFAPERAGAASELGGLDVATRALVARADHFFIATAHPDAGAGGTDPAAGVDVSHRGGPAGFVEWVGDTLLVPDFVGNSFFNTLGNLALEPRCGLLFLDADRNERLELAARAELVWSGPQVERRTGAQRLLRLHLEAGRRVRGGLPLAWREVPQL